MRSSAVPLHARVGAGPVLRGAAFVLGGLLALRFAAVWANAFAGTTLPVPGSIGFTLLFTAFSLLHAISTLGWRRALSFFMVCAGVSWCFEAVGLASGLVYGPYHYGD